VGTGQFFFFAHLVALYAFPTYQPFAQVLSDLGATHCIVLHNGARFCSPEYRLFNVSLVLQGCCMCFGSLLLHNVFASRWALSMCGLAGASLFGIALVPENAAYSLHVQFAALHCIAANVAIFLLAAHLRTMSSGPRMLSWLCIVAGVVGTLTSGLLLDPNALPGYEGFIERLAVFPFALVLMMLGLWRLSFRVSPC